MRITKHFIVNATAMGLALVLLQTSCAAVSDDVYAAASESTANEPSALATAQGTTSGIVADFRATDAQAPAIEPDAKKIVDASMGSGAFERYRLADSAQGHFTSTEQLQSLHVIVNREVTAVAKKVTPSILVIFQDDRPITQFVPPKASYLDIASVFDIDQDGLNEVILTASAYQMGSRFVAADVYGFKNANDILKQEIGVVYVNSCDSAVADDQQVRASMLSVKPNTDELIAESHIAPCNENGEPPSVELFTVEPAQ